MATGVLMSGIYLLLSAIPELVKISIHLALKIPLFSSQRVTRTAESARLLGAFWFSERPLSRSKGCVSPAPDLAQKGPRIEPLREETLQSSEPKVCRDSLSPHLVSPPPHHLTVTQPGWAVVRSLFGPLPTGPAAYAAPVLQPRLLPETMNYY